MDGTYVPIPIKIQNFKNSKGVAVNDGDDASVWRYVTRFMIIDPISGISQAESNAEIYRYARQIKLRMEFDGNSEKIYRPILTIEYASRRSSGLETNPKSESVIETEY